MIIVVMLMILGVWWVVLCAFVAFNQRSRYRSFRRIFRSLFWGYW